MSSSCPAASGHEPAAGRGVAPALRGPLHLEPFRARRLDLSRVAGAPGEADRSVSGRLGAGSGVTLDDAPSLHVHEYLIGGRRVRGLVGLISLDLADLLTQDRHTAALLPHESADQLRTMRLADRMSALALDPAPILLLPLTDDAVPATDGGLTRELDRVVATAPHVEGQDARRGRHRLWRVTEPDQAETLRHAVRRHRMLLADGHHRWAAHLALERRSPPDGDGRALIMVVDTGDRAPALRALHRVVTGTTTDTVLDLLAEAELRPRPRAVGSPSPPDAPLRLAHDELVVVDQHRRVRIQVPHSEQRTVVETLHAALAPLESCATWHYHHRIPGALRQVEQDADAVALILPPSPLTEVAVAAEEGRLLPVKATSFQPKPPLGVLFRSWHDG